MDGSVFGAGRTQGLGYSFDAVEFLKRPITILRLLSLFFALIVFSCVSSGGFVENECIMNGDGGSCGFGIFVGVIAFIACIVFLVIDILMERISSVEYRRYIVMGDLGFSGVWTFFYFVSFCYMTNKLSTTPEFFILSKDIAGWQLSNIKAAISFSFFSILSFGGLTFLNFQRYRDGAQGVFESSDQAAGQGGFSSGGGGYSGYDSKPDGGYQQGPFNATSGDLSTGGQQQQQQQYQQPSY